MGREKEIQLTSFHWWWYVVLPLIRIASSLLWSLWMEGIWCSTSRNPVALMKSEPDSMLQKSFQPSCSFTREASFTGQQKEFVICCFVVRFNQVLLFVGDDSWWWLICLLEFINGMALLRWKRKIDRFNWVGGIIVEDGIWLGAAQRCAICSEMSNSQSNPTFFSSIQTWVGRTFRRSSWISSNVGDCYSKNACCVAIWNLAFWGKQYSLWEWKWDRVAELVGSIFFPCLGTWWPWGTTFAAYLEAKYYAWVEKLHKVFPLNFNPCP